MIKEVIKVYFPYLKALAEDKEVQCDISGEWKDIEEISFSIGVEHYRIKPKSKYRPFKTREECWQEMMKHHPFGWLKSIKKQEKEHIGRVFEVKDNVLITLSINEGINNDSSYFFNEYTFDDGAPFGIKED